MTLGFIVMVPAVFLFFDGERERLREILRPLSVIEVSDDPIPVQEGIVNVLRESQGMLSADGRLSSLEIIRRDGGALFLVEETSSSVGLFRMKLRAFDSAGTLLGETSPANSMSHAALEVIGNLHFGSFGSFWGKLFYAVVGSAVFAAIASGLLIWMLRKKESVSRLFSALFIACSLGFLPAVAAGFTVHWFAATLAQAAFWGTLALIAIAGGFLAPRTHAVLAVNVSSVLAAMLALVSLLVHRDRLMLPTEGTAYVWFFTLLTGASCLLTIWISKKIRKGS